MLRLLGTFALAGSIWVAALALPTRANANEGPAITVAAATARAEIAAPKVKRTRKASVRQLRRVASVAVPAPYHSQCFLFWCGSGGRSYNFLMLGIGY